jgi:SecD/SecF fusion protein
MPRAAFSQIANKSMSEVLTRSLITGLSTVFLVSMLLVFGGATLQDFAFAMMVGVASGFYSSIFIATPVLTHWKEREPAYRARRQRLIDEMGYLPTFPEDNAVAKLGADVPAPVGAPAAVAAGSAAPEPADEEPAPAKPEAVAEAPAVETDGADGAEATPSEPEPLGATTGDAEKTSSKRAQRDQRRKRQRRRRKHGRHR